MTRSPSGHSLVELVVALALAGLLTAAGLRLVRNAQEAVKAVVGRVASATRHREVLAVLRTELWAVDRSAGDLVTWSTDSITYRAVRALLASCRPPLRTSSGWEVVVHATPRGTRPWRPEHDGLMVLWPDASGEAWRPVAVPRVRPGSCANGAAGTRLDLGALPNESVPAVVLLRAFETVTVRSYRGSDGQWWVGATVLGAAGTSQIQPFAGPVPGRGLRFTVESAAATVRMTGSAIREPVAHLAPRVPP